VQAGHEAGRAGGKARKSAKTHMRYALMSKSAKR
jgi:hypothetical protein